MVAAKVTVAAHVLAKIAVVPGERMCDKGALCVRGQRRVKRLVKGFRMFQLCFEMVGILLRVVLAANVSLSE